MYMNTHMHITTKASAHTHTRTHKQCNNIKIATLNK